MERWGLGPEDVHAGNPRRDLRAGLGLRADRPLPRPAGLRRRRGGDRRPALHQRLPRPGAAAHAASRSATRSPRSRRSRASCSRSTPATRAGRRPGGRRLDRRRLLRDDGVDRRRVREDGLHPRADRAAPAADRAVERLPAKDGKWVVIAANHDTLWRRLATVMGHPELPRTRASPTHHARGENEDLLDEIIGALAAAAHGGGARRDRQRGRRGVRARLHGAGHLRRPVLPRARAARRARGRGPRRDVHDRRRAQAHGTPGRIRRGARWTVGADTEDVLGGIGIEDDAIASLREDGIV